MIDSSIDLLYSIATRLCCAPHPLTTRKIDEYLTSNYNFSTTCQLTVIRVLVDCQLPPTDIQLGDYK